MIKLNRIHTPKALSETDKAFNAAIADMNVKDAYNFYKKNSCKYSYNTEETKRYFRDINSERCSFCTKFIQDFDDEMTVEHIKLKRDYPQLIFQWTNLLCACRTCNIKRSTKAHNPEKYLDPSQIDDIENYFCYQLDGTVVANEDMDNDKRKKAKHMIKMYDLNRDGLVCKRREFLNELISDDDHYGRLKNMDKSSQNIIFLSVFAYYRRCKENNGEQGVHFGSDDN